MLLRKRSLFFIPTYPPSPYQLYRFSHSSLRRNLLIISKHHSKAHSKRTYATQRPDLGGSATNNSNGGIPLGKIHLGSVKIPAQKGIAIKDDITKKWKELNIAQKIVRTGTQTANLAVVIVAIGVLVCNLFWIQI
jgi:hypothetical protein